MVSEKNLINLADKKYVEIAFNNISFKMTAPMNYIFYDGKKSKEYIYENYLFKTIEDAKQNAVICAYFDLKNNSLINLKDKKFEAIKSKPTVNC